MPNQTHVDLIDTPVATTIEEFEIIEGVKFINPPVKVKMDAMIAINRIASPFAKMRFQYNHNEVRTSDGQISMIPIDSVESWKMGCFIFSLEKCISMYELGSIFKISINKFSTLLQLIYQQGDDFTQGPMSGHDSMHIAKMNVPHNKSINEIVISEPYLLSIRALFNLRNELNKCPDYDFINSSIELYLEVERSLTADKFRFLTLCSVLEMLICHKADPNISIDSTSHQMANKLEYMINIFDVNDEINDLFGDKKQQTKRWKELYGMRSKIAHGSNVKNFDLKYCENLDVLVRLALRIALAHPKELRYLRQC